MSPSLKFQACALALAVAASGVAAAKSSDRNQPMDIEADRSDCGLGDNASCTLVGNVAISQGTMRVAASRAVIHQAGGNPSRAVLSGGVTLRQQLDDGGTINARAANVDYDMRTEVVTSGPSTALRDGETTRPMSSSASERGSAGSAVDRQRSAVTAPW